MISPVPAPTPAPREPSMAAPAMAPTTVPSAAPRTMLSCRACSAVGVAAWAVAKLRHSKSSKRKVSKLLPLPGKTSIEGPVGAVAQALNTSAAATRLTVRARRHGELKDVAKDFMERLRLFGRG